MLLGLAIHGLGERGEVMSGPSGKFHVRERGGVVCQKIKRKEGDRPSPPTPQPPTPSFSGVFFSSSHPEEQATHVNQNDSQ